MVLKESFVLRDLQTFKKAPHFLENPRLYSLYPELACDLAEKLFTNDGKPRKKVWQLLNESIKDRTSLWQMACDLIRGARAL